MALNIEVIEKTSSSLVYKCVVWSTLLFAVWLPMVVNGSILDMLLLQCTQQYNQHQSNIATDLGLHLNLHVDTYSFKTASQLLSRLL